MSQQTKHLMHLILMQSTIHAVRHIWTVGSRLRFSFKSEILSMKFGLSHLDPTATNIPNCVNVWIADYSKPIRYIHRKIKQLFFSHDSSIWFWFIVAVHGMDLPFLNAYVDSLGLPNFHQGCNFAVAGSTILPATAASISPFSFGAQVSQFLLFKARVLELLKGK